MAVNTDFSLQYQKIDCGASNGIPVLVLAGGSSSRMKGTNKITAELCGIPVIVRTLLAFERSDDISEIVISVKEENMLEVQHLAERYMISKLKGITSGGNSRAESVLKGIQLLAKDTKLFLVHDGARPLVSREIIKRVVNADNSYSCVICAVPCTDTVKEVKDNVVVKTPSRSSLVCAQTPQRLDFQKYSKYIYEIKDFENITDDASVMEKHGEKVLTVEGDAANIKITRPLDMKVAEALLGGSI